MPQVSATIDKFLTSQALSSPERSTIRTAIGAAASSTSILTEGLLTGGGDLSASSLALSVEAASLEEVAGGYTVNKAVTPGNTLVRYGAWQGGININGDLTAVSSLYARGFTSVGFGSSAYGDTSSAFGYRASTSGARGSTATGAYSQASMHNGSTYGYLSCSFSYGGCAYGAYSYADECASAFGYTSRAVYYYSSAFGYMASGLGARSIAIGAFANATAASAIALGESASSSADGAVAVGPGAYSQWPGDIEITSSFYYTNIARLSGSGQSGAWQLTYGVGADPDMTYTGASNLVRENTNVLLDGMMTFYVDRDKQTLKAIVNIAGIKYTWSTPLT